MSVFAPGVGRDELRRNIAMNVAKQTAAAAENQHNVSYAALFRHFAPRVNTYLQLTGLPGEAAEELAQETMFRVWRNAHCFDADRGAAATWDYQIARNFRRNGIRREKHSRDAREMVSVAEIYSADAAQLFFERQGEIMIDESLRSLEPKLYEPIRLVYFEHLSRSQVARRLDVPLGTVKSVCGWPWQAYGRGCRARPRHDAPSTPRSGSVAGKTLFDFRRRQPGLSGSLGVSRPGVG